MEETPQSEVLASPRIKGPSVRVQDQKVRGAKINFATWFACCEPGSRFPSTAKEYLQKRLPMIEICGMDDGVSKASTFVALTCSSPDAHICYYLRRGYPLQQSSISPGVLCPRVRRSIGRSGRKGRIVSITEPGRVDVRLARTSLRIGIGPGTEAGALRGRPCSPRTDVE